VGEQASSSDLDRAWMAVECTQKVGYFLVGIEALLLVDDVGIAASLDEIKLSARMIQHFTISPTRHDAQSKL
jgi:hypothetical protein